MRRTFKRGKLLTSVVLITAIAGGGIAWAVYAWDVARKTEVQTAPNLEPIVTVAEGIAGLYPGAIVKFKVEVKNPNPYPIRITSVEGSNPDTFGCTDFALALVQKTPKELAALVVAAGQTRDLGMTLEMKDWAPKECADKRIPFNVRVKAQQQLP